MTTYRRIQLSRFMPVIHGSSRWSHWSTQAGYGRVEDQMQVRMGGPTGGGD